MDRVVFKEKVALGPVASVRVTVVKGQSPWHPLGLQGCSLAVVVVPPHLGPKNLSWEVFCWQKHHLVKGSKKDLLSRCSGSLPL